MIVFLQEMAGGIGNREGMSNDIRFVLRQDRESPRLFAPSLREAIADDPEVVALDGAVEQLDFSAFEAHSRGGGRPAYPPQVMVKVLLYGYSLGLRSSRQLERACRRDDAFRFLAHGLRPDHVSLWRFREVHGAELAEVFCQTVARCQQAGLVGLGHVAVDGSKVRANCSREAMAKVRAQCVQMLEEAQAADGERGEAGSPEASPESQGCEFMKTQEGILPAYNAQVAVDSAHQVIVAQTVVRAPDDRGQLGKMLTQVERNCEAVPQAVSADGGYYARLAIAQVQEKTTLLMPTPKPGAGRMEWVAQEQAYRCPQGKLLRPCGVRRGRRLYRTKACLGCAQAKQCGVTGKSKEIHIPEESTTLGKLAQRMQTAAAQARYQQRSQIVEPVFGCFKHNWGCRRFLARSLRGVRGEWSLLCAVHNLKKWIRAHLRTTVGAAAAVVCRVRISAASRTPLEASLASRGGACALRRGRSAPWQDRWRTRPNATACASRHQDYVRNEACECYSRAIMSC